MLDLFVPQTISFPLVNQLVVLAINIVGVLLILTVIKRNSFRDKLTSVFVTMGILMFVWIDCAYVARLIGPRNITWAETFLRVAWTATPLFFAYVYLITVHILRREKGLAILNHAVLALAFALGLATAFTDYIIEGINFSGGNLDIIYGRGFYPFLAIISLYIVVTIIPIIIDRREGVPRRRIRTFLFGLATFYLANMLFNIALPVFFGVTHLYYFGDYSLVFFLGFTAYAIIRHGLMDIRAALARSVSFSLLLGLFFILYAVILAFAVPTIHDISGISEGILAAFGALLAVWVAGYVRNLLSRLTDNFLFQQRQNYQSELIKASDKLSGTIRIDDVTRTIFFIARDIIRSSKTVIMLRTPDGNQFSPIAQDGEKELHLNIPRDHAIAKHLRHTHLAIVKDELILDRERETSPSHLAKIEEIIDALNWLDAMVVLPLFVNRELNGFIILGERLSGEPYFKRDLDFLAALSPQAAVALENARLYKASLEFGRKLELEVRRATHELEVANAQLRDLDKAKSEFLSVASHQLNTPLTPLRGYLSMLLEGEFGEVPGQQRPIIEMLEKSSIRLVELIKNYLDISRIESGRLELNLESINLVKMSDNLVKDLLPNAISKDLELVFHPPAGDIPQVVADRQRIRQVMLNFVDNAIKYTDRGTIEVSVKPEGNELVFAVTDTGRGLSQQEIAKLFTKFTRVGGRQKFRAEGTGLGLYVAKQIVGEHNGRVEVTSPGPGQGSTFAMRLPIEKSPHSLVAGQTTSVMIKAANAGEEPGEDDDQPTEQS